MNSDLIQTIPGLGYSTVNSRCFDHDGVIVDVGCLGWDWSKLFIGKKRVIGIDPQESATEATEIFKGLLGSYDGICRLYGEGIGASMNESNSESKLYDIISWKELCKRFNIDKVSVLKINIEGAEYSLLSSMTSDDFRNIDQIAISFHDWLDPNQNELKKASIKLLENEGFTVQCIEPMWGWYLATKNNPISDKNVFIYWEGDTPPLISVLRDLIYSFSNKGNNYKVNFINDSNVNEYIKVDENYWRLKPNHKSDYIRAKVIHKYGGIWLDSDTLVMSNLNSLFNILESNEGFLIKENNEIICSGVFGAKKGSPFLAEWSNRISNKIKDPNLSWSDIGPTLTDSIFNETDLCKDFIIFDGLDTMYPINWPQCPEIFLHNNDIGNVKRNFQPLVILVNSVYRQTNHLTKGKIVSNYNNLGSLLREAIQQITKNKI
jgi:hypothetical protein